MIAMSATDVENVNVPPVTYKGKTLEAKGVSVRWLSKAGVDPQGGPAYGLRLFTIGPGGEVPIHNHAYLQTMYIVSGQFECWEFSPETDEIVNRRVCGPGDMVYVPGMEPHGMRNISDTEPGTFLCCICTLGASEGCAG
jgi:quercetin dioxygenase-like cupin family protein